ncbi:hypothetical protein PZE06_20700 [Robertmurraya sp. DFI.2.37]|uniref:endolytic transglycosylase MltG n=1 Tax=Robertmurraya sp. DFI.2.37 TaxID=3031819 RepID=UPI001247DA1B|nr:endolytic transglycosylase MltG [Robertmurraya sp. DFI.2.37]MDF1510556.1 hypothetical protein [Robertmurraya sp. DFI.2.37]
MNKHTLRAFALGIIFAVVVLHFTVLEREPEIPINSAKERMTEAGFVVLTKEELNDLEKKQMEPPAEEVKTDQETPSEELKQITLEIKLNMSTKKIADMLADGQIIENATEFEQYLIEHGYHTKVQIGSFELNSEMTYEEISKIITKNK